MRNAGWAVTAMICVGALSACGNATSPTPGAAYGGTVATMAKSPSPTPTATMHKKPAATKTVLTVKKTKIGFVLANAAGYTLYWFSKDVKGSGKSVCKGACIATWPALPGKPAVKPGLKLAGKLGFITRADGTIQATYNGYPLYTYSSDMAPGDTSGNAVGGKWHVISGKLLGKGFKATKSTTGKAGGY